MLASKYQNAYISQNINIYYTLARFYDSPGYQNLDILVSQITSKSTQAANITTKDTNIATKRHPD